MIAAATTWVRTRRAVLAEASQPRPRCRGRQRQDGQGHGGPQEGGPGWCGGPRRCRQRGRRRIIWARLGQQGWRIDAAAWQAAWKFQGDGGYDDGSDGGPSPRPCFQVTQVHGRARAGLAGCHGPTRRPGRPGAIRCGGCRGEGGGDVLSSVEGERLVPLRHSLREQGDGRYDGHSNLLEDSPGPRGRRPGLARRGESVLAGDMNARTLSLPPGQCAPLVGGPCSGPASGAGPPRASSVAGTVWRGPAASDVAAAIRNGGSRLSERFAVRQGPLQALAGDVHGRAGAGRACPGRCAEVQVGKQDQRSGVKNCEPACHSGEVHEQRQRRHGPPGGGLPARHDRITVTLRKVDTSAAFALSSILKKSEKVGRYYGVIAEFSPGKTPPSSCATRTACPSTAAPRPRSSTATSSQLRPPVALRALPGLGAVEQATRA